MFIQITLGRATKDKQIDVDLSLEGPAWKISRKQGDLFLFYNFSLNCIGYRKPMVEPKINYISFS